MTFVVPPKYPLRAPGEVIEIGTASMAQAASDLVTDVDSWMQGQPTTNLTGILDFMLERARKIEANREAAQARSDRKGACEGGGELEPEGSESEYEYEDAESGEAGDVEEDEEMGAEPGKPAGSAGGSGERADTRADEGRLESSDGEHQRDGHHGVQSGDRTSEVIEMEVEGAGAGGRAEGATEASGGASDGEGQGGGQKPARPADWSSMAKAQRRRWKRFQASLRKG